ncbi:MAG: hypothetical protein KGN76_17300 [Acidobacteriota bacterium]|nr:hypothetical protein [Acidobacteriota bacterium]
MRAFRLAGTTVIALTLSLAACTFLNTNSLTGADSTNIASLAGNWKSSTTVTTSYPTPASCGNFQWQVTNTNGATASGTFTATCAGGITLDGTAAGALSGSQVSWTASGTAHMSDGSSCPFSLTGVATLTTTQIEIPYSGTTCLGPISGTETLTKQ